MFILTQRQQDILDAIVERYISEVSPISSDFLRKIVGFDLSSATIRSEMAELEEGGYLVQPHTSAGRIPTEHAYRFFVDKHSDKWSLSDKIREKLRQVAGLWNKDKVEALGKAADDLAVFSQVTSMVTLTKNNQAVFLQRFSNFRSQPEFRSADILGEMLSAMDMLERRREDILTEARPGKTVVMIGKDIKLSRFNLLSLIIRPWQNRNRSSSGFIATVGPLRMHYERAVPMIDYLGDILSDLDE